ncbi:TetR/AcrR family transcriptional regulator [Streptomyces sp. bgisy027]|uniref:TetR/AcrR family transcriptional regulator n=1 Tax=unclassified Streptomyces TaxID=2593676 RepID=UPI003D763F3B
MEPRRATSPGEAGTVDRILDGALRAAARRGLQKLSMSDIGDSANVSRGTLYRYFASKDDVIAALPDHLLMRWEQHLRGAVAQQPRREDRVRVVMEAIIGYATASPELLRMIQLEPEFGLDFLERKLPDSVRIVADLLEPVIDDAAVVHARVITGPELAEILLRIAMSGFLVPGTRTRQLSRRVANFWDFMNVGVEETDHGERMAAVAQLSHGQRRRHA